jgi:prophage regulatory protein
MSASCRFIRIKDVVGKVGISRSQVYRLIQAGLFPSPLKIGPKVSVWSEAHVEGWMLDIQEQSGKAK